jgi:uncharacterized protein (DUF1800 family)
VEWHKTGKLAWPDENYARENLQLHSIGLLKLNDDGTNVLDRFEKNIANYEQKHIFAAAKVWTSFKESFRRGNYEDRKRSLHFVMQLHISGLTSTHSTYIFLHAGSVDYTTKSYLDPLQLNDASERDWFPKVSIASLCEILPQVNC